MNGKRAKALRKATGLPHPGRKFGGGRGIAQDARPNSVRSFKRRLTGRKFGQSDGS